MKIQITVVGEHRGAAVGWPDAWPTPAVGDQVYLPHGPAVYVRTVAWYPWGDEPGGTLEPFVYVVLGARRPNE